MKLFKKVNASKWRSTECPDTQKKKKSPENSEANSQLPVHLMFSEGNPWCCSCAVLYKFITKLHSMEVGKMCWNRGNCSLLVDDTGSCVKGITIPCYSPGRFAGVNLASGLQVVNRFRQVCCNNTDFVDECDTSGGDFKVWNGSVHQPACAFTSDWVRNNSKDCKAVVKKTVEKKGKSDNTTTLIGIFIVISIPLFLTFLPSCEKKPAETEFLISTALGLSVAHHKIAAASVSNSNGSTSLSPR